MIIIIIRLLQPPLHSPPFLRNFATKEQSSMKCVVCKEKLIRYLANLSINAIPRNWWPMPPRFPVPTCPSPPSPSKVQYLTVRYSWRTVRRVTPITWEVEGLILMDTTWCDAHQSLLATWMRNQELINAANFINLSLRETFYLDMWGGTTFDVAMRFFH